MGQTDHQKKIDMTDPGIAFSMRLVENNPFMQWNNIEWTNWMWIIVSVMFSCDMSRRIQTDWLMEGFSLPWQMSLRPLLPARTDATIPLWMPISIICGM